jgi:hypothetical protein
VESFTTLASRASVTTGAASGVGANKATVHGKVNPNRAATSYHVEFGRTTAYGQSSPSTSAGAGGSPVSVSVMLTGLRPRTVYHYRVVASSAGGTAVGTDRTFKNGAPLPPPPRFSFSIVGGQSLGNALEHGLQVTFNCSATCQTTFIAAAARAGTTRVVAMPLTLARGSGRLGSKGKKTSRLSFTSSARHSLRNAKSLKLVISGFATGKGGNRTAPKTAKLTLKR